MTSRIVHFYFLRFRHIIRQFRHFVFRIGSYETDHSAISLGVAAKTRTKPTGAPPFLIRINMTQVSALHAKYADIFEEQTTMLSWTWRIYGIQYVIKALVKVDIRTNKPLNGHFRFRLSCRLRYRYRPYTR